MNDRLFKIRVVDHYGGKYNLLYNLLKRAGNIQRSNANLFCPFHDNYNTPSAKYYKDDDKESIWCFSEGRGYTLSNYYELILGTKIDVIFNQIWDTISEDDKQYYIDMFGEYKPNEIEVIPDDIELYEKFKTGSIGYKELLVEITK